MTDGIAQRPGSSRAASPSGHDPRHVAGQAAAGDVGDPVDVEPAPAAADRRPDREQGPRVDPGRRQQDVGERRRRRARPRRTRPARGAAARPRTAPPGRARRPPRAGARARSRCCGGPTTARPTSTSPAPTARPSSRSSRSTTPTQVAARSRSSGRITPGCSAVSPPSRAQPASRQPAATPADDGRDLVRHEPPDGHVVEEEERLGAGADDVVGAHRDEVDPEPVEAPGAPGEGDLRAHAVGRGDEQRPPVARRDLDGAGEAAEPADDLRPARRGDRVAHQGDGPLAGLDVDAGGAVGVARPRPPFAPDGSATAGRRLLEDELAAAPRRTGRAPGSGRRSRRSRSPRTGRSSARSSPSIER